MSREIKFRAWDKLTKKMRVVKSISWMYEDKKPRFQLLDAYRYGVCYSLLRDESDIILMQFIGLKDKNGKEVYEGDIVRLDTPQNPYHPTRTKTIIWSQRFAQFCVDPCTSIMGWKSVEVIGNIHQNPELMEQL